MAYADLLSCFALIFSTSSLYGENEKTGGSYRDSILTIENYLAEASRSSVELRDETAKMFAMIDPFRLHICIVPA